MKILGIETSCDETAASIVEEGTRVLSSVVASSLEMHVKTGGIVPEVAAREQVKSIIPVIDEAFKKANITEKEIDAIAVTVGPGLIGSLLIGVETAKTLAWVWKKPLIPVNHLIAHIYSVFLDAPTPPLLPAVCLIASGGHTDLVLFKNHKDIIWIGGTVDDAAGEAFDKVARILGLGYPGGPAIAVEAAKNDQLSNFKLKLPRPMIHENNLDFSFSGLKTAVLRAVESNLYSTPEIAYEFQEAVVDCLVKKTLKAMEKYGAKSIIAGGGVAANTALRRLIGESAGNLCSRTQVQNIQVHFPELKYCGDNGAMVASAGFFNNNPTKDVFSLEADPGLHFG
jgi:N6-L-threonylcarbamoyladenine synthase